MSIKVMDLVWDSAIRGSSKRFVLLALADRASDEGEVPALGSRILMQKTGLGRTAVFSALRELEESDELILRDERVKSNGGRDTSRFWLNMPLLRELRDPKSEALRAERKSNPFAVSAAQAPVREADGTPVRETDGVVRIPDGGVREPYHPSTDSVRTPVREADGYGRPESVPLPESGVTELKDPDSGGGVPSGGPEPEVTQAHRDAAGLLVGRVDLSPVDAQPKQVTQVRNVVARAFALGYQAEAIDRYLRQRVEQARTVRYVLGAFAPNRIHAIGASGDRPPAQVPVRAPLSACATCGAHKGDPGSARMIETESGALRRCECHPGARVAA